jgi:choline dehydrogenase-like flavoprotein
LLGTGALLRRAARRPSATSPASPREAILDALLPPGRVLPGALEAGVALYLARALADPRFAGARRLIEDGVTRLDALAIAAHGQPLRELERSLRARLLDDALAQGQEFPWPRFRQALLDFALEGYLGHPARGGNTDAAVWRGIGLPLVARARPAASDLFEPARTRIDGAALERATGEPWDAIVVGSGAGGGVVAWRLAAAGMRVLVLEKGAELPRASLTPDEIGSCLRDAFVPYVADDPHVLVERGRSERSFQGWTSCCVGGGTVHMGAMFFRLHEEDFDSRSRFGPIAGSTLCDWPIGYAELAPFYDRIQTHLALSGRSGSNPFDPPSAPFPQAPLRAHPAAGALDRAALAAGLHPFPTPRGILSAAHAGRNACVQCGYCGAYACPVGAKASAADAFLPLARASGRCRVLSGAQVLRVIDEADGRASGVLVLDGAGAQHRLRARIIVMAASAVETARLLLLSTSARHPAGLGNQNGQVGQNLVVSLESAGRARFPYPSALFPREHDARPFINRSLQDRYRDAQAPGPLPRAGTLVLERAHFNPIQRARRALAAEREPLRSAASSTERLERALCEQREIIYESFVEMLPRAAARVSLDSELRGADGQACARIAVDEFPHEAGRAARLTEIAHELLARMHASEVEQDTACRAVYFLQGGTCRMGRDESSSVCDARGRVHGVAGLVIADGSALPSLGGVPPTFTIMANALRIAEGLLHDAAG